VRFYNLFLAQFIMPLIMVNSRTANLEAKKKMSPKAASQIFVPICSTVIRVFLAAAAAHTTPAGVHP
jgi:hypothetical protein